MNFFRRKKYQVNLKETIYARKDKEIWDWLNTNCPNRWRFLGYVKPKPEELEYAYLPVGLRTGPFPEAFAVPNAFIGFEFNKAADAVMFEMIKKEF